MLPREWLKRIHQLEVKTRLLSQQLLSGEHVSIFQGRGIDFDDVRPYQPGDDVRRIDWNVTARMQQTYIKRYMEEREITFIIMVDVSASGHFSTQSRTKLELAAEIAGTLAFSAAKNNDRIGLLTFSDGVEKFIPPAKGQEHVMHLLRTILFHRPKSAKTSISQALRYLNKVQNRPAIVFLISDFQSDPFHRALTISNQRHSMAAFVIGDAAETSLPAAGWMILQDPESGELVEVNTSRKDVRMAFAKAADEYRNQTRRALRRTGVKYMEVDTKENYLARLAFFLSSEMTRKIK
jgi:uncharacterized protein (DUF58 family)